MANHNEVLNGFRSYPIPQTVFNLERDSKGKNGLQVNKVTTMLIQQTDIDYSFWYLTKCKTFSPGRLSLDVCLHTEVTRSASSRADRK